MVRPLPRFRSSALLLGALLLACQGEPYGRTPPAGGEAKAAGEPAVSGTTKPKPGAAPSGTKAPAAQADAPLGKILPDAPLPLGKMLGAEPAAAEAFVGPPLPNSKGEMRDKCVRFLPERTWFRCRYAWQRYTDETNTFGVVQITFEDGKVAGVSVEDLPGSGDFDPRKALSLVGLDLPLEPKVDHPTPEVTVWTWWNARARLRVHGREHFVRVSSVNGTWDSAKVEIILNDHLTADEKSRVIEG